MRRCRQQRLSLLPAELEESQSWLLVHLLCCQPCVESSR